MLHALTQGSFCALTFQVVSLRTTAENLVHLHHTTINLSALIVQASNVAKRNTAKLFD